MHFNPLIFCLFSLIQDYPFSPPEVFPVNFETSEASATSVATFNALTVYCPMPTGLYTTDITETSATFNWSPVSEAQSYSVQTRLPSGTWSYVPGSPFMNTLVTVTGFSPGTTYEWRVRSNCDYGEHSYWTSPVTFTTYGSMSCETPDLLNTLNITQTTATLDWSSVSGAVSYSVQWRYPGGSWHTLVKSWPNSWINIGGLQPGTMYEWRVRSNCSYGYHSDWSDGESFTTLGSSCHPPTELYTTNISETSATLNWSPVSGAESYSVQIRLPYGNWSYIPGSPFTNTSATVDNLDPGTTYEWRVRTNCGYGYKSYWSYPVSFTTDGSSSCEAPDLLNTLNITQTTATLDWSSVSGAVSYSVQWRYPGGTWHTLVYSWPNSWLNIGGLQPGTTYEWRVRSNCSYGNHSPWSEIASFTTLGASCHPPTELYTTNITETTATFNWSPVSGAQSYSVQIRLPYGSWSFVPGSPFTSTSVTVDNLSPGTTYEWRVRSNCGYYNKGYWSSPVSFTTSGTFVCTAPLELNTINITQTTATWDWSPVSGALSYSVQWRYPGGNWNNLYGGPWTGTLLNIIGLQPGTTYEWRVRSNCSYGNYSPWSEIESFTTLGTACHKPTGLSTTNITDTSATFTWSPVSGAVSYSVQIRLPNGYWTFVSGSPFTDTTATVNDLSPGTSYAWRVRSNCGSGYHSYWTSPTDFTTTGISPCSAPDSTYTSDITDHDATLNWSAVIGALSYTIQWREPGGVWYTLPIGPWQYLFLHISGLDPNTSYEWRVRANCPNGLISAWSDIESFTTLLGSGSGNDFCSNAMLLTVGSTCIYTSGSNVNATASSPEPQGNCPSDGYKDVWFKFTMPDVSYPSVTIRTSAGTLTDAVMEVYVGNSCSTMSYLVCENDNSNGNGSAMPVIGLVGGPGITVWVRIWGNNGSTGTFDICVFDYTSDNLVDNSNTSVIPIAAEWIPLEIVAPDIEAPETQVVEAPEKDAFPFVHVSPNPASDVLDIIYQQTEESVVAGLALSDLSGKILLRKEYQEAVIGEFQEQLDVSALTPGMYLLHVVTSSGILTEKIMIVR